MLTHSHIPVSFGGRFNILIGGPVMHQIHHGADEKHHDKNIGGAPTYIFDWLFGTLYLPVRGEKIRFGLNDEEFGPKNPHRTVKDFYLEPLVTAFKELRKTLRRRTRRRP
jgi:sterol desaturase/sphingolipid hydroxylase (fatty acid hydroxylase superfamily)